MKKLLFILSFLSFNVNASTNDIYEYKLDNGLKLVVKQDKKAPTALHMVWYNVGSLDEYPHKTGLSHILEHLMFKGTPTNPTFSKTMAVLGAKENAFTSNNFTAYHQQLPKENLSKAIFMEADRMRNLDFASKNFEDKFNKEIKVIQEERRLRTDDQPESKLYEQLLATAYITNGTRTPTIGWMEDIANTTYSDARDWYNKYYYPNNATVIILGDVEPNKVYMDVKKAYEAYKPQKIEYYQRKEIEQIGKKSIEMYSTQVKEPSLYIMYKTISYKDNPKHSLALALLSTLLTGYDYSYLDKNLIKNNHIASNISASSNIISRTLPHLMIYAKPSNGIDNNVLQNKIHNYIKQLAKDINIQDLERAKKQYLANNIYKKDSLFYTGMELGTVYTSGYDYKEIEKIERDIQKVSIEDIKNVINLYINNEKMTSASLLPK